MANANLLYVGIKGTAVALDRNTGREVWRTELPGSDFVNMVVDGDELYAASRGELLRLDPRSGAILWHNSMPGFGWGIMTIATAGTGLSAPAEKDRRDKESAASTGVSA